MKQHDVLKYAILAAAYLVANLSDIELKRVRTVLLFGSTARFAADEESDVDVFFDVSASKKIQNALRAKLNKTAEEVSLTNAALEFKAKNIDNEINVKVGKLEEWNDLAQSIPSHGIVIYGKYTKKSPTAKAYAIISWEATGKHRGALFNKLYGYRANNKKYHGLIEKTKSIRLGKAVVMVPAQHRDRFTEALEKYKVNYSRHDVWA